MLNNEMHDRAETQIRNISAAYRTAKANGVNISAVSLPVFEMQQDLDWYHPHDAGWDFHEHNEFAAEVWKGLGTAGVPSQLVVIRYAEYVEWLNGRENTSDARLEYGVYLMAEAEMRSE